MCASVHPLDHMFNLKTNEWILVKFDIKWLIKIDLN
jgi:hypothetical protein